MEVLAMKKKLFSLSDNVVDMLENHAQENRTSQSKVVEVAISIYLAMHSGAKAMKSQFETMQPNLFDPKGAIKGDK